MTASNLSNMSPLFVHTICILLFTFPIIFFGNCQKLDFSINPGCTGESCESRHLAFANFSSNDTSYHYYIDSLNSSISILIIETPPWDHSSDGHINWTRLANSSNVANALLYNDSVNSIGLVLGNLTLTQEPTEEAERKTTVLSMDQFEFTARNESHEDSVFFSPLLSLKSKSSDLPAFNLTLDITMNTQTQRHPNPPGLLYSPGAVHVDLTIQGPIPDDKTDYDISIPFQLIQLGSFSMPPPQDTIDDEYSPGVFALNSLQAIDDTNRTNIRKSFVQFRPVAYLKPDHISTQSLDVSLEKENKTIVPWDDTAWPKTAAYGYFSNLENSTENRFFFKFPAADVYVKSNFTTFTFTFGLGEPASEQLSPQVIWIIIIGVGLPSLALVFGLGYLVFKKLTKRSSLHNLTDSED